MIDEIRSIQREFVRVIPSQDMFKEVKTLKYAGKVIILSNKCHYRDEFFLYAMEVDMLDWDIVEIS